MSNFALLRTAGHAPKGADLSTRPRRGLLVRARTRLRRPWLDREIARGADCPASPALALRETQLVCPRERTRLARRLEQVLVDTAPLGTLSGAVRVDVGAVDVARPLLTELILSLRSSEAVEAQGVVLAWRLLTEATSPVYLPPGGRLVDPDRLWHEALAVLSALRPLTPLTEFAAQ